MLHSLLHMLGEGGSSKWVMMNYRRDRTRRIHQRWACPGRKVCGFRMGTGVSTCPLAGQVCGHRNSSHLDLQCMVSRRLYFTLVTVCRPQLAQSYTARTGLAPIDGALSGFVMPKPKPKPEPKPELALPLPLLLLLRLGLRVEWREGKYGSGSIFSHSTVSQRT